MASAIATLWANQIILGKKTFLQVPALLKEQVREILIKEGREDLIIEEPEVPTDPQG